MTLLPLLVFIDESGDFNFSPSGSKFYTITALITHHPYECCQELTHKRFSILSRQELPSLGQNYLDMHLCHRFHACEDKQVVRDEVFKIITSMGKSKCHSIVVQKNKANPVLRPADHFYPKILSYLLDYIFKSYLYSNLCIFINDFPVASHKQAFVSAIKTEIIRKEPSKPYQLFFPSADSNHYLQVCDYINWAIYRKWENGDVRSYDLIKSYLGKPELDIYQKGTIEYYAFKK